MAPPAEHPDGSQRTPQGPRWTEERLAEAAWFEQLEGELVVKGRKLAVRGANKVKEGPPGQPREETAKATRALNKQILPRRTERETEVPAWATPVPRMCFLNKGKSGWRSNSTAARLAGGGRGTFMGHTGVLVQAGKPAVQLIPTRLCELGRGATPLGASGSQAV